MQNFTHELLVKAVGQKMVQARELHLSTLALSSTQRASLSLQGF